MREGKGLHEPDKAASFAAEVVLLYKIADDVRQMKVATEFADTLARKIVPSDNDHSPWPHRVHAETGEVRPPYVTNHTGAQSKRDDRRRASTGSIQLPLDEVVQ